MLLRSMRVTEKKFWQSFKSKKEQFCVAAKAGKNVYSSTQSFGTKEFKQFYKYGR